MSEKPFGGETKAPAVEAVPVKTKTLGEGESTGWENEQRFSAEEVIAAIKEFGLDVRGLKVTQQLVSHDGVLLSLYLRAPGSRSGYEYMLKGRHDARNACGTTSIEFVEYDGTDSEDVVRSENVAKFINGVWVKMR